VGTGAKALILGKISKLSEWSINFLSNFCSSKDNLNCTCMFDKRGNFKEANPTCPVTGHIGSVLSVCFDHTGKKLASGGGPGDNSVRVWSAESGAPIGPPLNGHSDEVNGVCFSPDDSKLASCSDDRSVKIWNLITRECVSTLSVDSGLHGVQSISYSPAGDMIAAGCDNGTIHLLDTGTVAVKRSLSRHRYTLFLCFSTNTSPNRCTILE
jgi:WD40 repeat protein